MFARRESKMLNSSLAAGRDRADRRREAMEIQRVGVVGCGLMGSGIAEAAARAGLDVRVVDLDQASLDRGRQRISDSIGRAQKAAKLSESEAEAALANIEYSADLGSLADRQLVVEAVVESEAEKVAVFEALDKVVDGARCRPGLEHLVDPDHEAGHGHGPPQPGHRHPLLQPGAGAAAGGGGLVPPDQ